MIYVLIAEKTDFSLLLIFSEKCRKNFEKRRQYNLPLVVESVSKSDTLGGLVNGRFGSLLKQQKQKYLKKLISFEREFSSPSSVSAKMGSVSWSSLFKQQQHAPIKNSHLISHLTI